MNGEFYWHDQKSEGLGGMKFPQMNYGDDEAHLSLFGGGDLGQEVKGGGQENGVSDSIFNRDVNNDNIQHHHHRQDSNYDIDDNLNNHYHNTGGGATKITDNNRHHNNNNNVGDQHGGPPMVMSMPAPKRTVPAGFMSSLVPEESMFGSSSGDGQTETLMAAGFRDNNLELSPVPDSKGNVQLGKSGRSFPTSLHHNNDSGSSGGREAESQIDAIRFDAFLTENAGGSSGRNGDGNGDGDAASSSSFAGGSFSGFTINRSASTPATLAALGGEVQQLTRQPLQQHLFSSSSSSNLSMLGPADQFDQMSFEAAKRMLAQQQQLEPPQDHLGQGPRSSLGQASPRPSLVDQMNALYLSQSQGTGHRQPPPQPPQSAPLSSLQAHLVDLAGRMDLRRVKSPTSHHANLPSSATASLQAQMQPHQHQQQMSHLLMGAPGGSSLQQQQLGLLLQQHRSASTPLPVAHQHHPHHVSQSLPYATASKTGPGMLGISELEDSGVEEVVARACRDILAEAASHSLKAVELANTLRARVGTEVLAHIRERWGGLLSLLERHAHTFRVERIPKNDLVTLVGAGGAVGGGGGDASSRPVSALLPSPAPSPSLPVAHDLSGPMGMSRASRSPPPPLNPLSHSFDPQQHQQQLFQHQQHYQQQQAQAQLQQAMKGDRDSMSVSSVGTFASGSSSSGAGMMGFGTGDKEHGQDRAHGHGQGRNIDRNEGMVSRCLHVGNVPANMTEAQLLRELERYGDVDCLKLVCQRSRRFAFVSFHTVEQAVSAKQRMSRVHPWKSAISFAHKESTSLTLPDRSTVAGGSLARDGVSPAPRHSQGTYNTGGYASATMNSFGLSLSRGPSAGPDALDQQFAQQQQGMNEEEQQLNILLRLQQLQFGLDVSSVPAPASARPPTRSSSASSGSLAMHGGGIDRVATVSPQPRHATKGLSLGLGLTLDDIAADDQGPYPFDDLDADVDGPFATDAAQLASLRPASTGGIGMGSVAVGTVAVPVRRGHSASLSPPPQHLQPQAQGRAGSPFHSFDDGDAGDQGRPRDRSLSSTSTSRGAQGTGRSPPPQVQRVPSPSANAEVLRRLCDDTYVPTQPWPVRWDADSFYCSAVVAQLQQFGGSTTISKLRGFLRSRVHASDNIKSVPLKAMLSGYPAFFTIRGNQVGLSPALWHSQSFPQQPPGSSGGHRGQGEGTQPHYGLQQQQHRHQQPVAQKFQSQFDFGGEGDGDGDDGDAFKNLSHQRQQQQQQQQQQLPQEPHHHQQQQLHDFPGNAGWMGFDVNPQDQQLQQFLQQQQPQQPQPVYLQPQPQLHLQPTLPPQFFSGQDFGSGAQGWGGAGLTEMGAMNQQQLQHRLLQLQQLQ